jgi:hypothetical protein
MASFGWKVPRQRATPAAIAACLASPFQGRNNFDRAESFSACDRVFIGKKPPITLRFCWSR